MLTAMVLAVPALVCAKLPAPQLDAAAKAKAAEAAAKTAWQGKKDAYDLCKAQDRVAAVYKKSGGAATAAPKPAASGPAAAEGGGTPVKDVGTAAVTVPPCTDPGPFAYNPAPQTPLETSGAHSPAGTAAAPPSVKQQSADLQPAKK
jgi:hypothetical protein